MDVSCLTNRFEGHQKGAPEALVAPITLPVWSHFFQYPSSVFFDFPFIDFSEIVQINYFSAVTPFSAVEKNVKNR